MTREIQIRDRRNGSSLFRFTEGDIIDIEEYEHLDWAFADMSGVTLSNSHLKGVCLDSALLSECTLIGIDAPYSEFREACALHGLALDDAQVGSSYFDQSQFVSASLRNANLAYSSMCGIHWSGCDLTSAALEYCNLNQAVFEWCLMSHVSLEKAEMHGCTLNSCYLHSSNLVKAELPSSYLRGVCLVNSDLSEADLNGCDLTESRFTGADLTGAVLRGAVLLGTDFRDARLEDADFTDAVYSGWTHWPEEFDPSARGARRTA